VDLIPPQALAHGFVNTPVGSHTSRTIVLQDLRDLLAIYPPSTSYDAYRVAIVDENVLQKRTRSSRIRGLRQLRELYALDRTVLVFRALRDLWDADKEAQPLLAMLSAVARDPIVRVSAEAILSISFGELVTPEMLEAPIEAAFPERYSSGVRARIGRNLASSWQQSGHLNGKVQKVRVAATSRPTAVAYALFLGYLCGERGDQLFSTLWCQLLDAPLHLLHEQAIVASRYGWIDYRHAGNVTDITFRHLQRVGDDSR
jgi:hypothetical protein